MTAAIIFLLFYAMLPALNPKSQDFFVFLILCILIFLTVNFISCVKEFLSGFGNRGIRMERDPLTGRILFHTEDTGSPRTKLPMAKPLKYGFGAIGIIIVFMMIANIIGIPFFNATRYRDLIKISDGDFTTDVELDMSQIPVVDKDTASRLEAGSLARCRAGVPV